MKVGPQAIDLTAPDELEVLALEDLADLEPRLQLAREQVLRVPRERRPAAMETLRILEVELLAQRTNLQRRTRNVVR